MRGSSSEDRWIFPQVGGLHHRYERRAYRRLTSRKGRASAQVDVARKLAIPLYIMLRDKIDYEEFCRRDSHAGMLGEIALA